MLQAKDYFPNGFNLKLETWNVKLLLHTKKEADARSAPFSFQSAEEYQA
jgi:hypothetical protein